MPSTLDQLRTRNCLWKRYRVTVNTCTRVEAWVEMTDLTISVDDEVLKRARLRALQEDTSVNALLRDTLETYAGVRVERESAVVDCFVLRKIPKRGAVDAGISKPWHPPFRNNQVLSKSYVTHNPQKRQAASAIDYSPAQ